MDIPKASLEGKVALVTGGGRSIGKGIALGLATYGADIVVADIDGALARETASEVEALGRKALAIETDVRELAKFQDLVKRSLDSFGAIHVLVNNVGGNVGRKDFLQTGEREWQAALQVNLMPTMYGIRLVAPEMLSRGIRGSIINVSTIEAFRAAPGYSVYAAAKAGVISLTQTLALELGPQGIRVNAIAPDVTPGPRVMMGGNTEALQRTGAMLPLGRVGRPEDYAGTAVYLASGLSTWVTGETFHVGGGTHAAAGWNRYPDGVYRLHPGQG